MKVTPWLLLLLAGAVSLNFAHIIYFNIYSHSLPYGIYMRIGDHPQKGNFAATCLTPEIARYGIARRYLELGQCDNGSVFVIKIIKGIPGDFFAVKNGFLRLNGEQYYIMNTDSSGRSLKMFYHQKQGIINKGKYILLSDFVPNSWDSRYWGQVDIQFLLKPLWLFENVKK
jgi:conjugative transfer signal peptidase TraF